MWRITTTKALASRQPCLTSKHAEHIVAVSFKSGYADTPPRVPPPRPAEEQTSSNQDSNPGSDGSSNNWLAAAAVGGVLLVGATGTLCYANDNARFWVADHIPFTKGAFSRLGWTVEPPRAAANPELKASNSSSTSVIDVAEKTVSTLSVSQALSNDQDKKTEAKQRREQQRHEEKMEAKHRKDEEYLKQQDEKKKRKAALELEKQRKEEIEQEALAEAALTKIRKNQEFEAEAARRLTQVNEVAKASIQANKIAITTCREHNSRLKEAMDVGLEEEALKIWPEVQKLNEVRLEQVDEAHRVQLISEVAVVEYIKLLDEAKKDRDTKDNTNIGTFRKQIQELAFDVKTIHDKLKNQEQVSSIMKHYYHMMKKDKADFLKELEAIVPQIRIGEKGLNLSEEELNALLAHAHRRIFQLKKQLREQQLLEHQRLEDALCEQKKLDMKEANIKIGEELDKQYEDLMLEKEAEVLGHNRTFESELRTRLSEQASEHHDHLQDMLALQQKKLMEQFDLALRERLIHERHVYIDHIAKNIAKVKGLESALEARADLEKSITEVQSLMSSSLCLMHAVAHDIDCTGDEYDRVRIDDPLKKCFHAAEMSPFAQAVLHSIPDKAVEEGIYTMSSLEKRFNEFYDKTIGEASHTSRTFTRLFSYILNYTTPTPKPKFLEACEFDTAEGMSPLDLLIQAKYFMDKKCLPEVVRCIVQLEGTSRELAQDWLEEARLVLEVRQAAEVLMAYANSKGMGTIF